MKNRLDAAIGIVSGIAQSTTIVHAQLVVLMAISLQLRPEALAWLAPVGFVVPLVANGLTVFGDWVSTRALCLWAAGITLVGAGLLAWAGLALGNGQRDLALILVTAGSLMVPAALRHGDLVVAHLTLRARPADQIRQGRTLRTFLVVGIYLPALPAGLLVEAHGWPWVFAAYAVLNGTGFVLLALKLSAPPERLNHTPLAYLRHFLAQFGDGRLVVAAIAALLVRALVFAWVTGVPVALIAQGHSATTVGLVAAAGLLAAPFVLVRPAKRRDAHVGLGLLAGALPIGVALVLAAALYASEAAWLGSAAAIVSLTLLAVGTGLTEAAKQVGQLMTSFQATLKATDHNRFRRLGVANLGGNVGALLGAAIGPLTAGLDIQLWCLVVGALAVAYVAILAGWLLASR